MKEITFEALKARRDLLFNELVMIPMEWAGKDAAYWNRLKRRYYNIEKLLTIRLVKMARLPIPNEYSPEIRMSPYPNESKQPLHSPR